MAPLYQRYIPGAVSQSVVPTHDQPVAQVSQDEGEESTRRKRKREASQEKKTSRKAQRLREELVGSQDEVEMEQQLPSDPTAEVQPTPRTGEFAHVKSSKKRHKLEKEARKARKLVERSEEVSRYEHTDLVDTTAAAKEPEQLSTIENAPTKEPKRQKRKAAVVEEVAQDEDDSERLKKHSSLLGKFEKAQRRAAQASKKTVLEDVEENEPVSTTTIVDPLMPIEVDTSMPDVEPTFSALPSWITSAKRVAPTTPASFESLQLDENVLKRLHDLDFTTALPVQQALLPILLPPHTPGSAYGRGTEGLLPDVAISAPTGSGKTLAYLLPIVEALKKQSSPTAAIRALVIVPTRELVAQVAALAESLTKESHLVVSTASVAAKLKDEQQRLVTIDHRYAPTEYRELFQLAQMLDCPPSEDSPGYAEFIQIVTNLDEDKCREIDSIASCPIDHINTYQSSVDILVCTPGRLLEHLDNTPGFELSHVQWLVLDEADKLLDEQYDGFLDRLHQELETPRTESQQDAREKFLRKNQLWNENIERRVRKVVLSATMTRDVSQLAALRLRRPQLIMVGGQQDNEKQTADETALNDDMQTFNLPLQLHEHCVPVGDGSAKPLYLIQLLEQHVLGSRTDEPEDSSSNDSDDSEGLSSDSEVSSSTSDSSSLATSASEESEEASRTMNSHTAPTVLVFAASTEAALRLTHLLKQLRPQLSPHLITLTKSSTIASLTTKTRADQPCVVIATDRAGRGLDVISGRRITHVIQYDVPRSVVSYVHRVGRTARAGRSGQAWTLYTNAEARWFINEITKAESIHRSSPVERVRYKVDDEHLQTLYSEALAGMRDIVFNNPRQGRS